MEPDLLLTLGTLLVVSGAANVALAVDIKRKEDDEEPDDQPGGGDPQPDPDGGS